MYFDNAATSHPKPEVVLRAHSDALRSLGSAGRGGHKLALDAARTIFDARTALAEFLSLPKSERLVFTPGCTYSLNMVLKGIGLRQNDAVVVTALEHNAVMRPLAQLQKQIGIRILHLPYTRGVVVTRQDLLSSLRQNQPRLCVVVEGSNVTGEILDIDMVSQACKQNNVPLLVDAAQTAGRRARALAHDGITFWAASAHKGFFGSPGLGLLYVHPNYDLEPLVAGGTGSNSESTDIPSSFPDRLEPGTMAVPAIAALGKGLEFINSVKVDALIAKERRLQQHFLSWCKASQQIELYSATEQESLPIVSFRMRGLTPDRIADILDRDYGMAVRAGLHCAAGAHRTLGTCESGLVRASFGFFNEMADVDQLCSALQALMV